MVGMTKQNFSDVKFLPPGMLRTRHGLKSLKWTQNGQILTDSKNFFVSNLGFLIRIHLIHGGDDETKLFWCQIFTPWQQAAEGVELGVPDQPPSEFHDFFYMTTKNIPSTKGWTSTLFSLWLSVGEIINKVLVARIEKNISKKITLCCMRWRLKKKFCIVCWVHSRVLVRHYVRYFQEQTLWKSGKRMSPLEFPIRLLDLLAGQCLSCLSSFSWDTHSCPCVCS